MRKANFKIATQQNPQPATSCYKAFISNVADADGFANGRAQLLESGKISSVQIGQKDWQNDNSTEAAQSYKAPANYKALQETLAAAEKAMSKPSNIAFSVSRENAAPTQGSSAVTTDSKSYEANKLQLNRLKQEQKTSHFKMGFENRPETGAGTIGS